jgi:hypothetical protein
MMKLLTAIALVFFSMLGHAAAQGLTSCGAPLAKSKIHFAPQWPSLLIDAHSSSTESSGLSSSLVLPSPTAHFAFFCRLELKIEQATSFPVKFRLGNVEYVDRLEGKRD